MHLAQLITYFDTAPALKLLRASNAPFIIDFLHQQFKVSGHITLPHSELQAALTEYRERLRETHPEALSDKSEQYLSTWCSGESRWLHRFLEGGRNEPIYQLTPHTEDVFVFLDRVLQKDPGFVGTESRLRLIFSILSDLVIGASRDPQVHLRHLQEERTHIDEEITRLERGGLGARDEPTATRERFAMAVSLLKQLLADFRAVEDRFKDITQQVQQRQALGQETRGSILQFALDAEDVLKQEDEGISFHEFVRFILSPSQQDKLQAIITELGRIEELAHQQDGLATVRRMVPSLLAEAEKVMRTNQRLSATLRRLLDTRAMSDRKRLAQLIGEIRVLAVRAATDPPVGSVGVTIDVGVSVALSFSRTFWTPPQQFDHLDLTERSADDEQRLQAFQALAQMQRLDWRTMRGHVSTVVDRRGSVTLRQLLAEFPPAVGTVELLGYIQIARDDGHLVNRDMTEEIVLLPHPPSQRCLRVTVPLVTFLSGRSPHHA
jgi:hypothetical protein